MILIEAVPNEVSKQIVEIAQNRDATQGGPAPIIGCGAGPACHGHVVVLHDALGLTEWQPPFAKPLANLAGQITAVAVQWRELVESGQYLKDDHPYEMRD